MFAMQPHEVNDLSAIEGIRESKTAAAASLTKY
jgi:hypothetical protein